MGRTRKRHKMTITRDDVGVLDVTPNDFGSGKLKGLAKFDKPLKENSLIYCTECRGRYGIRKWIREVGKEGLICPRCGTKFEKGTLFVVDYFDREVSEGGSPPSAASKQVGAAASIKGIDKLIRKDEK